jgi:hypothetical protein
VAKCFQVVGQGIPVRMSDDDAFQIVERDHDGQYCPKSVWKTERNSAYRTERGDNCLRKLVGGGIVPVDTLARELQHSRRR